MDLPWNDTASSSLAPAGISVSRRQIANSVRVSGNPTPERFALPVVPFLSGICRSAWLASATLHERMRGKVEANGSVVVDGMRSGRGPVPTRAGRGCQRNRRSRAHSCPSLMTRARKVSATFAIRGARPVGVKTTVQFDHSEDEQARITNQPTPPQCSPSTQSRCTPSSIAQNPCRSERRARPAV